MHYQLFKRMSLLGAILALCVVVLGAYVRLSDAGLGCPDWPGCYGTLTVPQSEQAIQHAQKVFPHSPVETGKAWKEMAHRYLAGSLGLVVLAIFICGWRCKRTIRVNPILPTILLLVILFQAALGMWTVTMLLKPVIVSAHLIGGMTTLGLLIWIAHRHWASFSEAHLSATLRYAIRFSVLVVLGQIFLGGWTSTNYAALACTDFPTCHGAWVPPMDFKEAFHWVRNLGENSQGGQLTLASLTAIQWTHRVGALLTLLYVGSLALRLVHHAQLKHYGWLLTVILVSQISIGIANLVLHLPLILAVGHNLGAALLFASVVLLNSRITQAS